MAAVLRAQVPPSLQENDVHGVPPAGTRVLPNRCSGTIADSEVQGASACQDDARKVSQVPRPYLEIETQDMEPCYPHGHKISLDLTPLSTKSVKSIDSSMDYQQPDQTIIILDWDDTMCPSTTCMRNYGYNVLGDPPGEEHSRKLEALALELKNLLHQAAELAAKVVIVTNAEEGWVDLSCKAWLPGLYNSLSKAEVISARSTWEPRGVGSPCGWKAKTFEDVIDKFYSRYEHQSWKNIISIGDAPHEREALFRVMEWAPLAKSTKRCRSKSIKLVLCPTIEQLTREIQMIRSSLKEIVCYDDDLDLHFSRESLEDPPIEVQTVRAGGAS